MTDVDVSVTVGHQGNMKIFAKVNEHFKIDLSLYISVVSATQSVLKEWDNSPILCYYVVLTCTST